MADGGLHRTAYGTNPHSLSSSAIDSATASGITEREPIKLVSRRLRAGFLGLTPEEQQSIRKDPSNLNKYLIAKTYKKTRK